MANEDVTKPLSVAEREYLKNMLQGPGFKVLTRLMDSYIAAIQQGAILASESDPLNNAAKVANEWAYVAAAKTFKSFLLAGVEREMQLLRRGAEDVELPPEEKARRHKWKLAGMLGPVPDNFK